MFGRRKTSPPPAQPAVANAPRHRKQDTESAVEEALADLARRRAGGGPATVTSDAPPSALVASGGYQALSQWYAAGGRMDHAALALWAHDLRAMRPLLGLGGQALLEQVVADAGDDPYGTVDRARVKALDALFANGIRTVDIPELVSSAHVADVAGTDRPQVAGLGNYDDLRATADHLMRRATISPDGPEVSRRDARRSDLAALDALLVSSAQRCGDVSGVTVELRRSLANQVLATMDHRLRNLTLLEEVREVRVALRTVVEPHEVAALNAAFAAEPA